MNPNLFQRFTKSTRSEFFSAKDFLCRALLMGALFLIAELAGLRDYTTFLSGTSGSATAGWQWSAFLGSIYILAWLGLVLVTPILLLAAGLVFGWHQWRARNERTAPAPTSPQ
jgi:hypothetical protein